MNKELDFLTDLLGQFLVKENPETVAKILSRLDTTFTAVLGKLPREMHGEVVYHLFQLRMGPFGLLRWTVQDLGGIEAVAEILNNSESSTEKNVLDFLDAHDPKLAEEIRNQMYTFEDIIKQSDREIQIILSEVDQRALVIALKGASQEMRDRMLSNVSERVRIIQEEMASIGPVRVLDVEDAQLRIVQQVRQLEVQGSVAMIRGEGDYIV
jgi:flagellar motor switch protein FliG